MQCPRCQAGNRADRRFCAACGAPLELTCPACGFANQPQERFCGGCGAAVGEPAAAAGNAAPDAERRQVTVLFCDLTGSTALTRDLGAEAMHALTDRFFERVDGIVEGYGGTIDKHIGDCVMAVFGAPRAHGNDPERAIRAALEIRAALPEVSREQGREIRAHIGIASGQVVASGGAGGRSYSITGESVNLASRLTDAAEPDTILIADGVRAALAERLQCAAAGKLVVKGFAEPVTAWRLEGLRAAAGAADRPFVGRRAELAQFEAILQACRQSGAGQAVHLRGEAGIGKTRLVEEFQRRAAPAGFTSHTGLVLDFGAGTGRDAIRALIRSLLGIGRRRDPTALAAVAEQAVAAGLASPEQRVYLNDLLDLGQPTELRGLYDAMDNPTRNRGKRATVAALVRAASRRQPTVLVVEDLHWADRPTLDHLATLTETVAACPAILITTARIEGDPLDRDWRSGLAGGSLLTIDLGPLRPQEAVSLAAAHLGADGDFARRCVERAAGNPLFLEQLLRHLEDDGEAGVPSSVQSLVQARVDQLEPADRQALQTASILGQQFSLDALRHLIQSPGYGCTGLIANFLVRPQPEGFLFAHALIREAVYDSLLQARRRELHRRAAEWYATADPALHAEHLDRAADPQAPAAYLRAAQAHAGAYHYERALALTERGRAIAAQAADVCALTRLQGEILHDLGRMPEAKSAYEAALAAASDDAERCRAWLGLAAVKRVTDDLDGAFADLERAQAAAEALGLTAERARIHFLRGNLFFPRGELAGCLREHQRSFEFARAAGSPELEAQALGGLGDAEYVRGRMITAHRHLERCVELARAQGLGRIEVANRSQMAHAALYFRPLREALDHGLMAARAAAEVGHLRAEINARAATSFALYVMGDWPRLAEESARLHDLIERLGARRFSQTRLLYLGKAALFEGDRSAAVRILREALEISEATGITFHGPNILGGLALALSDAGERRAILARGEAIVRKGSVGHNPLRFYADAIDVSLELEDWDEAERYASALADFTGAEPMPWSDFFIARGRALAALGRDRPDGAALSELKRLRRAARKLDYRLALPAIERALAGRATG